jgi:hypothetical protein
MREEGLLKLFFAGVLEPTEAAETLHRMRAYRLELAARLHRLEPKAEEKLEQEDPFPLMVLRGGIEFNEWFAEWCERMERRLLSPVGGERS